MQERRPRLEGKVAIVTGAGSSGPGVGTGRAASVLFAREGARVLLADLDAARAEETLGLIEGEGGEASVFEGDVSRADDCQAMVEAAGQRYGGLDILFNNVAVLGSGTVVNVEEQEWDRVMNINLKRMMLTSKYAVPRMSESGGGSIINVSSVEAVRSSFGPALPYGSILPYSVSKGGVVTLTTCMAVQHGRDNIRVNCIVPGFIYTPMVAPHVSEEMRDLRSRAAPLGTEGTAWDVAWAAVFLASDEARWVSGVVLPVDAGLIATTPLAMLPYLA